MLNRMETRIPLPSGLKIIAATNAKHQLAAHKPYPAMVGAILYAATLTRPDLAFTASVFSRTASKLNKEHVRAARHLLWYIKATLDICLTFDDSGGSRTMLGYADANRGGCLNTRRSTTGYVFKAFGGPVA